MLSLLRAKPHSQLWASTKGVSGSLFFPAAISHTFSLGGLKEVLATHYCGSWSYRARGHCCSHARPTPLLRICTLFNEAMRLWESQAWKIWGITHWVLVSLLNNRSQDCRPHSLCSSTETWWSWVVFARHWMHNSLSRWVLRRLQPRRPLECISVFVCKTTHCVSSPTLHVSSLV